MNRRSMLVICGVVYVCSGAANADVRLFVTSSAHEYGLDLLGPQGDGTGTDPEHEDWPIDPFRPTYSTFDNDWDHYGYDYFFGYYRAAAYPPIDAPSGTINDPILIDVGAGAWGYMWFQFREEPRDAQVNGLITSVTLADGALTDDVYPTYYVQNDASAPPGAKRFDGGAIPPDYENWHANPFVTDQVVSASIVNSSDRPRLMQQRQATNGSLWTGVALLGTLTGAASDQVYSLQIEVIDYSQGLGPVVGESCYFRFVPEPSSAVLLSASALLLRRRRGAKTAHHAIVAPVG